MRKYTPIFDKEDNGLIILDNLFEAEECLEYASIHNMKVLMTNTTSASSIEIIMAFQNQGFNHTFFEKETFAPDGIKLNPQILCLFEKNKEKDMWSALRKEIERELEYHKSGVMQSMNESMHGENKCKEFLEIMDRIEYENYQRRY